MSVRSRLAKLEKQIRPESEYRGVVQVFDVDGTQVSGPTDEDVAALRGKGYDVHVYRLEAVAPPVWDD